MRSGGVHRGRATTTAPSSRGDGGPAEHPGDLDDGGVLESLGVRRIGQGRDGGVVLVEPDGREERDADDHADHPRHHDERGCRAVGVPGRLGQRSVVDRSQRQTDPEPGEGEHERWRTPRRASPRPTWSSRRVRPPRRRGRAPPRRRRPAGAVPIRRPGPPRAPRRGSARGRAPPRSGSRCGRGGRARARRR